MDRRDAQAGCDEVSGAAQAPDARRSRSNRPAGADRRQYNPATQQAHVASHHLPLVEDGALNQPRVILSRPATVARGVARRIVALAPIAAADPFETGPDLARCDDDYAAGERAAEKLIRRAFA